MLVVYTVTKPMIALQLKLFLRAGEPGIIPHLQPLRCTRSTYVLGAGEFTYEPDLFNSFPVILTYVLT